MRRSRKPVWAFPSIGGSNPPLSVIQAGFPGLSSNKASPRTVAADIPGGSTQASAGPASRGFVPSTFPPDALAFDHIEVSRGGIQQALEPHIRAHRRTFVGEQSTLARSSADRPDDHRRLWPTSL
jgi:hypothetical protein